MSVCSIDGCDKPARTRGLCSAHYERLNAPGYTPPLEAVRARYREQAKLRHPDAPGGSHAQMTELNAAVAEYEKEYP